MKDGVYFGWDGHGDDLFMRFMGFMTAIHGNLVVMNIEGDSEEMSMNIIVYREDTCMYTLCILTWPVAKL